MGIVREREVVDDSTSSLREYDESNNKERVNAGVASHFKGNLDNLQVTLSHNSLRAGSDSSASNRVPSTGSLDERGRRGAYQ